MVDAGRAYLVKELKWAIRLGRLAYSPALRGVGLKLVKEGELSSMWLPIGLGVFWRKRTNLIPTRKENLR